jgi:hypothetical protein
LAIDTTNLFTTIGRIGKLLYLADQHGAAIPAALDGLFDRFTGYADRLNTPNPLIAAATAPRSPYAYLSPYQQLARDVLLYYVRADNPAAAVSIPTALAEVRRQMTGVDTVKQSAVAVTPTAYSGNTGNGVVVTTATRPDGLPCELAIAETGILQVVTDSYTQTATSGLEGVVYYGGDTSLGGGPGDYLTWNWPSGSGAAARFNAIDSTTGGIATGNLVTNGNLELWTALTYPDNFTVDVGAANLAKTTSNVYDGGAAAVVTGGVAEVRLNAVLVSGLLLPLTSYALVVRTRVDTVPAAGTLTIELTDSAGTVLADAQAANNTSSYSLTGAPNGSYVTQKIVFRTGKSVPPAGALVRFRTLSMSSGSTLRLDGIVLTPMIYPYAGGPGMAIVGGSTPWAVNDKYSIAVTNDRGGASYNATFQALFERLFGMSQYQLVLPSTSGTPTQLDSLITS